MRKILISCIMALTFFSIPAYATELPAISQDISVLFPKTVQNMLLQGKEWQCIAFSETEDSYAALLIPLIQIMDLSSLC